jgi:HSP20 family protein
MNKARKGEPIEQVSEAQDSSEQHAQKTLAEQEGGERTRSRLTFRPRVDIYETEGGLVLLADVPGAKPGDLTIMLDRRVLSVRAPVYPRSPGPPAPMV